MVRENGHDEGIYIGNAIGQGQRSNDITMGRKTFQRLIYGLGKNITEGYISTDRYP